MFSEIDLSRSKDKRDFGKGFYTTTIYEQAEKWAKNQFVRYGGAGTFVKILEFKSMNKEWLEFVKENRIKGGVTHNYDIVQGPVANDNTMRTIALYISGIYTTDQAIQQLSFFKVNDQISFHSQKAVLSLHWKEDRKV